MLDSFGTVNTTLNHGSVESTRTATDVDLFLNLLARRLKDEAEQSRMDGWREE